VSHKPRILIADDHPDIVSSLERRLRRHGYAVLKSVFSLARLGVELRRHHPDLTLLDVYFRKESSLLRLRQLRRACPQTHFVVYTGADDPSIAALAIANGASGFLLKLYPEELVEAIEAVLGGELYIAAAIRDLVGVRTRMPSTSIGIMRSPAKPPARSAARDLNDPPDSRAIVPFEIRGRGKAGAASSIAIRRRSDDLLASLTPGALGSIVVLDCDGDLPIHPAVIVDSWRAAPWCPLVLLARRGSGSELAAAMRHPGMAVAVLRWSGAGQPSGASIRAAVARRELPEWEDVAAYVALRLGAKRADLIRTALSGTAAGTGLRRRLHREGLWSPSAWLALTSSVRLIARALREGLSERAAAAAEGLSLQTASRRCKHYYGCSWPALLGLNAWEPALELALRRAGYVS
jgi:DNA-binding NarL/FixJ family response regulator